METKVINKKTIWESDVKAAGLTPERKEDGYGATSTTFGSAGSISYGDSDLSTATIGSGWETWSDKYKGEVLVAPSTTATLDVSGLQYLGFQVEPDQFLKESFTVELYDGTKLLSKKTENINGESGARFFGFSGTDVTSVVITDNSDDNFAIGNFVYGAEPVASGTSAPITGAAAALAQPQAAELSSYFAAPAALTVAPAAAGVSAAVSRNLSSGALLSSSAGAVHENSASHAAAKLLSGHG